MKKRISAEEYLEETKKKSAKVLALTGETLLAGKKAEKLIGSEMTEEQMKAMKAAEEEAKNKLLNPTLEEGIDMMNMKRLYSRDEVLTKSGKGAIFSIAYETTLLYKGEMERWCVEIMHSYASGMTVL